MTIEEAALQAADPFAKQTMAQRAEHLADVATYIEENYSSAHIIAVSAGPARDTIQLENGAEIIRWLGRVEVTASVGSVRLSTLYKGVVVVTLVDSFVP